jgi:hypothetical protein
VEQLLCCRESPRPLSWAMREQPEPRTINTYLA